MRTHAGKKTPLLGGPAPYGPGIPTGAYFCLVLLQKSAIIFLLLGYLHCCLGRWISEALEMVPVLALEPEQAAVQVVLVQVPEPGPQA